MPFRSSAVALGIAKETVMGTGVAPTFWIPQTKLDGMEGKIDYLKDQSIRANDSMTQGVYQGVIHSEPGFDTYLYPELLPYLLRGMVGADTVTAGTATTLSSSATAGATTISTAVSIAATKVIAIDTGLLLEYNTVASVSGTGPYTITLTTPLKNSHASSAAVASLSTHTFAQSLTQPPTYTLTDWDQVQPRWVPGCMISELGIKIDAKQAVTTTTKWIGYPSANGTSVGNYTPGVSQANLGWAATFKIGGVAADRVVSCDFTIKRAVEPIFTANGVQSPRQVFAAPLEVAGKGSFIYESATADLADYLTNNQSAFEADLAFGPVLSQIHLSQAARITGAKNRGQKWLQFDVELEGIYNGTDSGSLTAFCNTAQTAAY